MLALVASIYGTHLNAINIICPSERIPLSGTPEKTLIGAEMHQM